GARADGGGQGAGSPRAREGIARNPVSWRNRVSYPRPSRFDDLVAIRLRDLPALLIELDAEPAHDVRQVGELALLDRLQEPSVAAGALLHLQDAVAQTRLGLIDLPLVAADTALAHGMASFS